ncbi:MAG: TetR/AcrR family transcriptional regulator [Pseudomonadota bacterium]
MTNQPSYHHGDLRQTLLEAACQHLLEYSADSLSLRALARQVGVSQTAPYRHFESKSALFAAIATWGFELMAESLREARDSAAEGDIEEAIERTGLAYVDWALQNPEKYQLFFDSSLVDFGAHESLHEAGGRAFDILLGLVQRGQDQGLFINTMPAEHLAGVLWSSVHGLASLAKKSMAQDLSARQEDAVAKALAAMNLDRERVMALFTNSIKVHPDR